MQSRAEDGILARREREGALAADEWLLDGPPCEERTGDADHSQDDLLWRQTRVSTEMTMSGIDDERCGT